MKVRASQMASEASSAQLEKEASSAQREAEVARGEAMQAARPQKTRAKSGRSCPSGFCPAKGQEMKVLASQKASEASSAQLALCGRTLARRETKRPRVGCQLAAEVARGEAAAIQAARESAETWDLSPLHEGGGFSPEESKGKNGRTLYFLFGRSHYCSFSLW